VILIYLFDLHWYIVGEVILIITCCGKYNDICIFDLNYCKISAAFIFFSLL